MNKLRTTAAVLLAGASLLAHAQTRERADPAAANVKSAAGKYESAYANYRGLEEEQPADWRDLNDTVGRVGGHAGVLRDQSGAAKPPAAGGAKSAPQPAPQAGHRR